ncbi:MAG: ubiquinone-dependent pyruvate dehydrogenase [Candidatus Falkowbacteria bacterium]
MAKKKVAQIFVEELVAAGVKRIYGIAGDSLTGITENVRQHPEIEWLHVRHEESAAFAAGAEAQLTGKLAVCAGSCGPGNLHLINGLYDCQRSRVPVLAIAAHIPAGEIGSGYFQETHPELLFKECSHYCELVSQPEQMPRALEIAMRTAVAKQGVAVIVIPGNITNKDCPIQNVRFNLDLPKPRIIPTDNQIEKAAAILNKAKKITILGGAGCANAHAELIALAGRLQAPIVHALRGKEFIEYDNPYDIGMTGLLGFSTGYHAMMDCDALLMLGTDFPYQQFYPTSAKVIQVDIRGEQIGRRTRVDLGLIGDVKNTIRALLPHLSQGKNPAFLQKALKHYRKNHQDIESLATGTPGRTPIHPQYVGKVINDLAAKDAIFTCDVGTPTIWASRYLRMNGQRRLLGSFIHGSMASALPQAIGIQASHSNRQVITFSGDGGIAMLLGDLLTLKQLHLPVKIVVFNNSSLGFVELEMKAAGILEFATELDNPRFSDIAKASGLLGLRAETPEQVPLLFKKMLKYDGPALLEVVVNRQELMLPPSISKDQVRGFGLFMLKAIMNGRGDEVIDLAKSNLFR